MMHSHPLHGDHLNIELFRYMCRLNRITDSGALPFLVPDTVVFNNARATQWFSFDAESGTLGRRPSKQLDRQIIFQEFSQLSKLDKSEICACFTTFHDCKLQSRYFTAKTLHSFLFGPSGGPSEELQLLTTIPTAGGVGGAAGDSSGAGAASSALPPSASSSSSSSSAPRIGILQKFVEPNKDNNEVFQVAWSPRMTYILRRYSKRRLIDRLAEPLARAATFDGPSTLSEEVYAGAGTKSVVEPFVKALVDHVRGADSGRYTIGRCLLFFKVDRQGQMWFLYCTSMRIVLDEEDRRNSNNNNNINNNNSYSNSNNGNNNNNLMGIDTSDLLLGGNLVASAANNGNNKLMMQSTTSRKRAGIDEYGQVRYQLHEPQFNFTTHLPTVKDLERLQIVPHIDSPLAAMLNLDEAKLQALSNRIQAKFDPQHEQSQRSQGQVPVAATAAAAGAAGAAGGGGAGGSPTSSPSPRRHGASGSTRLRSPSQSQRTNNTSNVHGGDSSMMVLHEGSVLRDASSLSPSSHRQSKNNSSSSTSGVNNNDSNSRQQLKPVGAYVIKSPASFPRRQNNEEQYPVQFRAKWDRNHLEQLHFNPPPVRPNVEPLILSLQRQENATGLDLSEAWDRSDDGANADHERLLYLLSLPGPLSKRELVRSRRVGQRGVVPPPGWEETREKLFPTKKRRTGSGASLTSGGGGAVDSSPSAPLSPTSPNQRNNNNNNNNSPSTPMRASPNYLTLSSYPSSVDAKSSSSAAGAAASRGGRNSPTRHFRPKNYNTSYHAQQQQQHQHQHPVQNRSGSAVRSPHRNTGTINDPGKRPTSQQQDQQRHQHRKILAGEGISASLLSRFLTPSVDRTVDQSNERIDAMEAKMEEIRREKERVRREMTRLGMKTTNTADLPSLPSRVSNQRRSTTTGSSQRGDQEQHEHRVGDAAMNPVPEQHHGEQSTAVAAVAAVAVSPPQSKRTQSSRKPSEVVSADLTIVNINEAFYLESKARNGMLIVKSKSNGGDGAKETIIDITEQLNDLHAILISRKDVPISSTSTTIEDAVQSNTDDKNQDKMEGDHRFHKLHKHQHQQQQQQREQHLFVEAGIVSILDERDPEQKKIYDDAVNRNTGSSGLFDCRVLIWYDQSTEQKRQQQQQQREEEEGGGRPAPTTPRRRNNNKHSDDDDNDDNAREMSVQYDDDFDDVGTPHHHASKSHEFSATSAPHLSSTDLKSESQQPQQQSGPNNHCDENSNNSKSATTLTSVSSPLVTGSLRGMHPSLLSSQYGGASAKSSGGINNNNNNNNNNNINVVKSGHSGQHLHSYGSLRSNVTNPLPGHLSAALGLTIFVASGKTPPSLPPITTFSDTFIMAFKLFAQSSIAATSRELKFAEQAVATISDSLLPLLVANREATRLENKYDPRRVIRERAILSKNTKGDRDTQNETVAMLLLGGAGHVNDNSHNHNHNNNNNTNNCNNNNAGAMELSQNSTNNSNCHYCSSNLNPTSNCSDQVYVDKVEAAWILDSRICTAAFNAGFAVLKFDELIELERISHEVAQRQVVEVLEEDQRVDVERDEDGDFMELHQQAWKEEVRMQRAIDEERSARARGPAMLIDGTAATPAAHSTPSAPRSDEHTASPMSEGSFIGAKVVILEHENNDDSKSNNNNNNQQTNKDDVSSTSRDEQRQQHNQIFGEESHSNFTSPATASPQNPASRRVSVVGASGDPAGGLSRAGSLRRANSTRRFSVSANHPSNRTQQDEQNGAAAATAGAADQVPLIVSNERRSSMWRNYDPGRRSSVFAPIDSAVVSSHARAENDNNQECADVEIENDDDEDDDEVESDDDHDALFTAVRSTAHGGANNGSKQRNNCNNKTKKQKKQNAGGADTHPAAVHIVIQVIDPLLADGSASASEGRMALRRFTDEALSVFRHGMSEEQKRYDDITNFFNIVHHDISQAGGIVTPRTRAANEKVQQQVVLQQQLSAKQVHLMPAPHGPYNVLIPGVPRAASDILLNPKKNSMTTASLGHNLSVAAAAKAGADGGGGGGSNAASKSAAAAAEAIARKNAAPARRGGMTKAELRQYVAICTFRSLFGTLEEFKRRYRTFTQHVNANFCFVWDGRMKTVVRDDGKRFVLSQQGRTWSEDVLFKKLPLQALAVQLTSLAMKTGSSSSSSSSTWWCRKC